jgi:hypothetical protein
MRIGFLKKESLHGVKRQKRLRPLILNHAAVAVCQIDRETRWFEEDLALFGSMRQATESRYAMEQELNLVIARTPNPFHRPHAKKVSPIEARKDRSRGKPITDANISISRKSSPLSHARSSASGRLRRENRRQNSSSSSSRP